MQWLDFTGYQQQCITRKIRKLHLWTALILFTSIKFDNLVPSQYGLAWFYRPFVSVPHPWSDPFEMTLLPPWRPFWGGGRSLARSHMRTRRRRQTSTVDHFWIWRAFSSSESSFDSFLPVTTRHPVANKGLFASAQNWTFHDLGTARRKRQETDKTKLLFKKPAKFKCDPLCLDRQRIQRRVVKQLVQVSEKGKKSR